MRLFEHLADQYGEFADAARGESPCLEEWALGVVGDLEVQEWLHALPPVKQQPNLVFAAARWHGVPAPGPYAGLRAALLEDSGELRRTILSRSTQTNEVGRLATLLPAIDLLARDSGEPLVLLEVGASAGLALFADRYSYRWTSSADETVHELGPGDPPVLSCRVNGPAPLPASLPVVSWRGGIDLNPLSVRDPDATAWLENLVWPEQEERRRTLHAAIEVAAAEPPYLVRGDLLDELPELLEIAEGFGQVVVFHSAVIAYLPPEERQRFGDLMRGLVASGACRWVSNEGPGVLPDVTATGPSLPAGDYRFVLGLDGQAVGWTHPHGASLTWW
ncbi:MAG: DUF2332 domain-containing protein [Nocardioidaceae bacterium]